MADEPAFRPAHSRDSVFLKLPGVASLDDLSQEWAWAGSTGKGVRVAVIDSGIDADHAAVGASVDVESGVVISVSEDGRPIDMPGPHDDAFGHGTACAGIIHGFAPEARLTSVRVLDPKGGGKAVAFLRGLAWAIERGFEVINLSLGTMRRDWSLAFYEICDQAYFSNSLIVTAANNYNQPSFPSLYSSVTSVASSLSREPYRFHYNPQPPPEFLAPGVDIRVAWAGGKYIQTTGNSFAAPHIAGVAALIRSKHPQLRPFQVKTVLWATAANVREAPILAGRLSKVLRPRTTSIRTSSVFGLSSAPSPPVRSPGGA